MKPLTDNQYFTNQAISNIESRLLMLKEMEDLTEEGYALMIERLNQLYTALRRERNDK